MDKTWRVENPIPKNPIFLVLGGLTILLNLVAAFIFLSNFSPSIIFALVVIVGVDIYIYGVYQSERLAPSNFVAIKDNLIIFESSPFFGMGWRPISNAILLEDIVGMNLVQFGYFEFQNGKFGQTPKFALQLQLKSGKVFMIGHRLAKMQLFEIATYLQGKIALGDGLGQLIGSGIEKLKSLRNQFINKGE